ncbi:uncharacterized protein LAJ45_01186 [Morchella importuna]|uniref:uncharacterized protein n=1 Tax=Morchella importuna TaxID=1174673 RepID=UPI001E8D0EDA|nr:uncharacterized protein LAJ45_01186 [Morchella importuna]KAH8154657.1 hypothetical protein LAJ45_01186 [Morchella importuna]
MSKCMPFAGTAVITQGDKLNAKNNLTVRDGRVVLSLTIHGIWKIKPFYLAPEEFSLIFCGDDKGKERLAMTLEDTPDDSGVFNIVVKPLGIPTPPKQLWFFADAIVEPREPPAIHGRIQCVDTRSPLSVGVGARRRDYRPEICLFRACRTTSIRM